MQKTNTLKIILFFVVIVLFLLVVTSCKNKTTTTKENTTQITTSQDTTQTISYPNPFENYYFQDAKVLEYYVEYKNNTYSWTLWTDSRTPGLAYIEGTDVIVDMNNVGYHGADGENHLVFNETNYEAFQYYLTEGNGIFTNRVIE